jgi:hypothetical protein
LCHPGFCFPICSLPVLSKDSKKVVTNIIMPFADLECLWVADSLCQLRIQFLSA